jgi:hypothetical protein
MKLTDYETTSNRGSNRLLKKAGEVVPGLSGTMKAFKSAEEVLPENAIQGQSS